MKSIEAIVATGLIVIAIMIMILVAYTSTVRTLTGIEVSILQIVALLASLGGSYIFGHRASKESIKEKIGMQARSAFRRLMSLYASISSVAIFIESEEDIDDSSKLKVIKAIVDGQINTADDALEDWRDLVPESVEEMKEKLRNSKQREVTQ